MSQINHKLFTFTFIACMCLLYDWNPIKDMPSLFIHALINLGLFNLCWMALLVANYFGLWLVNDDANVIHVLFHVHDV